jgi:Zn-finger nucleic acid-binding protein
MRTYERNGVHVDQCADCRGIFLDRGELDRLIDAENAWHGGAPAAEPSRPEARGHQQSGHRNAASGAGLGSVVGEVLRQVQGSKSSSQHDSDYHDSDRYDSDRYGKKRKKESFLGDLFG